MGLAEKSTAEINSLKRQVSAVGFVSRLCYKDVSTEWLMDFFKVLDGEFNELMQYIKSHLGNKYERRKLAKEIHDYSYKMLSVKKSMALLSSPEKTEKAVVGVIMEKNCQNIGNMLKSVVENCLDRDFYIGHMGRIGRIIGDLQKQQWNQEILELMSLLEDSPAVNDLHACFDQLRLKEKYGLANDIVQIIGQSFGIKGDVRVKYYDKDIERTGSVDPRGDPYTIFLNDRKIDGFLQFMATLVHEIRHTSQFIRKPETEWDNLCSLNNKFYVNEKISNGLAHYQPVELEAHYFGVLIGMGLSKFLPRAPHHSGAMMVKVDKFSASDDINGME